MTTDANTKSWSALTARLRALEARLAEFERFHMSEADHHAQIAALRRRHTVLNTRIEAAIARGDRWDMAALEFERDFAGLQESLDEALASNGISGNDAS